MPVSVLKKYITTKNKALRPMGEKICVNVRSAYKMHRVPITTSLNLKEDEVLTHIMFDTANTTENCKRQIEERIQKTLDAQYKPPPILWTKIEQNPIPLPRSSRNFPYVKRGNNVFSIM